MTGKVRSLQLLLSSALLMLGAIAAQGAPASAPVTAVPPQDARYIVLGYLWSDGSFSGGKWHLRERNITIADHFAAAAAAIGAKVTRGEKPPFHTVQITDGPTTVPLDRAPFDVSQASDEQIKAFLAAVMEGEGSQDGMVLDDPDRRHCEAVGQLLARLGVKTHIEGNASNKFFRIFAEKESWPIIQSCPFVAWGRCPGGKPGEAPQAASAPVNSRAMKRKMKGKE